MTPLDLALLGVMGAAVVALIFAERAESRRAMWVFKPLASAAFVALGWPIADAWLFGALVLSFLGDLCLIPADKRVFRAGILLFLLAHVGFSAAFVARAPDWSRVAFAVAPLALIAALVARWIWPGVARELRGAVVAYVIVITAMVALAAGTTLSLLAAAIMFWSNDILVARDRFVKRSWIHRLIGLPLYYGAMAIFALHASGAYA